MLPFSDETVWVRSDDQEDPLYMSIPIVLKLAVIHYYAVTTFSYVSAPVDTFEDQLIDYDLVYIANTAIHHWPSEQYLIDCGTSQTGYNMIQLELTVKGQEFLKKVPQAELVAELADHQFSPDRNWRWYPYEIPSDDVYSVAAAFMVGLDVPKLPQFLSHEISTIREKACELLIGAESVCIINKTRRIQN